MKYYLHDTSAIEDEKVSELFMQFGYEGVGLFYVILEKIGKQEQPIKTNVLKSQLSVGKKLGKCWEFMEQIGLISSNNGETFNKQLLNFSEKYQIKKEKTAERVAKWRKDQALKDNVTPYVQNSNSPKEKEIEVKEINKNKEAFGLFFDLFFSSFSFPQITAKNKPDLIEKYIAQLNGEEPHNVSFEFFIKGEFNLLNFKTDIRLDKNWLKTLQTELAISEQFIEDELKAFIAAGNINGFSSPDYEKVRTHFFNTIKKKLQQTPPPQQQQQQAPAGQLSDEVFAAIKQADQQFTTLKRIKRAFELSEPGDPTYLETIKETALRPGQLDWLVDNMQDLNLTITLAYPSKREIFFKLNPNLKKFENEIINYHRKIKFTKTDSPMLKTNFEAHCAAIIADKEAANV